MNIPCNITNLIYNMLRKFKLNYNGETIHTNKGLVQGSVLSPILFNLFINDLIILLEINGIMVRAYADDITWVCTSIYQTRRAVEIMENWITINKMKINPTKSGIIRILLRKGKIKQISNWLNIPEVSAYRYLGITINQTMKIDEHYKILKNMEIQLRKRIWLLKPSIINTKSRLAIFKTKLRSKMNYAWAVICKYNRKYVEKWESMIYRMLKALFWIKSNINKQKLIEVLNIENGIEYIKRITEPNQKNYKFERKEIIERLSLKTIKLKLNCLFQRNPTNRKWTCNKIINSYHVVEEWPKTKEWRAENNEKAYKLLNTNMWEAYNNHHNEKNNIQSIAELLNSATEELVKIYLW